LSAKKAALKARKARQRAPRTEVSARRAPGLYGDLVGGITRVLDTARRTSARTVNAIMTATYWEIGRRIVEYEQQGKARAEYGKAVLQRLAGDLTSRYGRGFGVVNLSQMKKFYLLWPTERILQTPSEKSLLDANRPASAGRSGGASLQTVSEESALTEVAARFPLPWSAYVRLLAVKDENARAFYETEALRAGWSVRQLDRQIGSQFYERTALSRDKAAMLKKGARPQPEDAVAPEEEIKDPYVLEFLGLRDEYSETDLEAALIHHLETFLLELGGDFCFIGRQRRLRIGDEWYRVDLVFYHRRLRCLVLIDLKLGRFTHADAGQMHTYLNYATEHWTRSDENPPVGLILCAQKDQALARYALDNLPNKVLAAEYRTVLPDEDLIAADLQKTRQMLERRGITEGGKR
jgi:predicted nuclease of restriction endonuclease-like (RecB) superfamily